MRRNSLANSMNSFSYSWCWRSTFPRLSLSPTYARRHRTILYLSFCRRHSSFFFLSLYRPRIESQVFFDSVDDGCCSSFQCSSRLTEANSNGNEQRKKIQRLLFNFNLVKINGHILLNCTCTNTITVIVRAAEAFFHFVVSSGNFCFFFFFHWLLRCGLIRERPLMCL